MQIFKINYKLNFPKSVIAALVLKTVFIEGRKNISFVILNYILKELLFHLKIIM